MIEAAMFIALGFLSAALMGLAILPAVYRRAVRLTQEAMKAINPSTYAEVRSSQDHERAQHALAVVRLQRALEQERQQAVTHRLATGKLTAELVRQKAEYEREMRALRQSLEAADAEQEKSKGKGAQRAAELDSVRQKLHQTEQALAAAQAEVDVLKTKSDHEPGWLPAADTMALATITGLESQIATLQARLAKYEAGEIAVGDLDLDARTEELKGLVKTLEAQLVDAETQFISAQAEVARLTVQIDSADLPHDEVLEKLERDLKWAEGEKARLTALTHDRERALERARGQIARLRQDLLRAPELANLRAEFVGLAETLAGGKPATGAAATADPASAGAGSAATDGKGAADAQVNALVSRIVKSSQANVDTAAQSTARNSSSKKASAGKDKKRDVA